MRVLCRTLWQRTTFEWGIENRCCKKKLPTLSYHEQISTSPYLFGRNESLWMTKINIENDRMYLASTPNMIQVWCERVQKGITSVSLTPVHNSYFHLEEAVPSPGNTVINLKRRRPISDVDGGCEESKKRRRLRHEVTTSRLSPGSSYPATYIHHRDKSKIPWARKTVGSSLMRKAAIVNRFRRRIVAAQCEAARKPSTKTLTYVSPYRPRPSPLGLFQQAARDDEDDTEKEYNDHNDRMDEQDVDPYYDEESEDKMTNASSHQQPPPRRNSRTGHRTMTPAEFLKVCWNIFGK